MFLFLRLLLAHLTADFLLQTDRIFRIKVKYSWGVLLHGSIAGLTAFLFAAPYLSNTVVITLLVFAWVIHIFQDKAKIIITLQVEQNNLWTFMLDQAGHILVAGIVAFTCINLKPAPFPFFTSTLDKIYNSNPIIIFANWAILLTYGMFVLQEYIKKTIRGDKKEGFSFPGFGMKYYGIFSRACVGIGLWAGAFSPLWYLLPFSVALAGFLMVRYGKLNVLDYQISTASATLIGVLMRFTV